MAQNLMTQNAVVPGNPGFSAVFENPREMHDYMALKLLHGRLDQDYDIQTSMETKLFDTSLRCNSFEGWHYNLNELWLTRQRWNMMVRQYVNPDALDVWADKIDANLTASRKRPGIAVIKANPLDLEQWEEFDAFQTNDVASGGSGRALRRKWGSCMLSLSFRLLPVPKITLHSRASYLGFLAPLDINVAYNFAKIASQITGISTNEMEFHWIVEVLQWHSFRSSAWAMNRDDTYRDLVKIVKGTYDGEPPTALRNTAKQLKIWHNFDKRGVQYADEKYASTCRLRRKWHIERRGEAHALKFSNTGDNGKPGPKLLKKTPSVRLEELDFSAIGR